jgi:hypothetical protein
MYFCATYSTHVKNFKNIRVQYANGIAKIIHSKCKILMLAEVLKICILYTRPSLKLKSLYFDVNLNKMLIIPIGQTNKVSIL